MESNIFRRFKQDSRQGRGDAILMSVGYGLGMLAMGLTALGIGTFIVYLVINKTQRDEEKQKEKEKMERILG
jgi:hypothetical protein